MTPNILVLSMLVWISGYGLGRLCITGLIAMLSSNQRSWNRAD